MNTLLAGVKELLGIPDEVTDFDGQLVMYINMALRLLNDIGFGPATVYQITLESGSMDDFLPEDDDLHDTALLYIYMKTRLLFDPPTTSFVLTALQNAVKESEWRLNDYAKIMRETEG